MAENTNTERDYPPLPEGWPARFRCDSCDGNGEVGDPISMGYFQPPERERCPDCDGKGWCSEEDAFSAEHMRAYVDADRNARASLSLPAAGQEPGAWPKDAAEVREFFKSDFISAQFAAPDHSPCDEDRYYISAHDFLSAINWWADFPNYAAPQPAVAAGWVPIETAPKDMGAYLFRCGGVAVEGFMDATGAYCVRQEAGQGWRKMWRAPTHWMPLPPAPSTEGESNG